MSADRASLSKVVSDQIRGQILDGTLRPGERLVEDRLSAELGVSRVPVREALLGLSIEGLVKLEPRRGASVAAVTPETVAELVEVRTLLEALNARLAARRHDPAIIALLQDTLRRGNEAAQSGSAEELARLNGEFHDRLAEASRNSVLSDIMRSLRERTSLAFSLNGRARAREDWKEHAGVLAAVIDGDEELAALLAARHVKNAAEAIEGRDAAPGQVLPPGEITLTLRDDDSIVRIVVEDNGKGLPKQGRERLTEPYMTTRSKGTGLGLAIVKKIMEDHGGFLTLDDREGGGARVSLVFRRDAKEVASVRSHATAAQ